LNLITTPSLLTQFAENGREKFLRDYTVEEYIGKLEKIFNL
jgi:hypothetical protein